MATVQWAEAKASSKAPASAPAAKRNVGAQRMRREGGQYLVLAILVLGVVHLSGCGEKPPDMHGDYSLSKCIVPGNDGIPAIFGPPTHTGKATLSEYSRYTLRLDLPGIAYEESGTFKVKMFYSSPIITLISETGGERSGFCENDGSWFWVDMNVQGIDGEFTFTRQ
jgi:hypothetical protein